ncbi:DUF7344 domain-containing protein [Haladaptatus salinisoli]|uniref:DUF7344 domain-containing protein n=1 Tax=Haladaptatus salinisoli TaxID=2884876 RepID=UPI001D09CE82|nr:hypothetical protein [Haladaptatus salinisoli]
MDWERTPENDVTRLLADARNRTIAHLVQNAGGSLHISELADRIASRHAGILESDEYEGRFERVLISLHHNHLPKLADAGLVEYDREDNLVRYRTDAAVDAEWVDGEKIDRLLARFQPESESDENAIGVLEDRASIIEHGRVLADEADEELFCMYISDDLLEENCICHAKDAVARDVKIYLGSQNETVRDLARRRLPEATLWEPQSDWVREKGRRIGRLVLADREKVMLALLDGDEASGTGRETAMIGEGWNNPLVVLVRELLGPRLDHLDYQSDEFRSELPF